MRVLNGLLGVVLGILTAVLGVVLGLSRLWCGSSAWCCA